MYEKYGTPIGRTVRTNTASIMREEKDRTMAKKPSMSATEAKKKALKDRGSFQVGSNTDYGKPYHRLIHAAVAPWVKASADSVAVWGDTLPSCVPPAFALRFAELKLTLDEAMVGDDFKQAAETAASLVKAVAVMDQTARNAGHLPPVIDGHLVAWGGVTYCLLASGSVSAVRAAHPSWVVYHLSDCVALLSARADSLQEVANKFPGAKIVSVGPMVEDVIDL